MGNSIIEAIDKQIARLQNVQSLLADITPDATATVKKGRGRQKGSTTAKLVKAAKRTMSKESRVRIAAAQKARRAPNKKAA